MFKNVSKLIHKNGEKMISDDEMEKLLDDKYQKYLGASLKSLRKGFKYKVSQQEMAKKLHVERQHIVKIESGKVRVSVQELICYSRMFNCPIENILFHGDYEKYSNDDYWNDRWDWEW